VHLSSLSDSRFPLRRSSSARSTTGARRLQGRNFGAKSSQFQFDRAGAGLVAATAVHHQPHQQAHAEGEDEYWDEDENKVVKFGHIRSFLDLFPW
jgi:hypothetical protein